LNLFCEKCVHVKYFFITVYLIEYNIFAAYFIIPCHITSKLHPIENTDQPLYSVKRGEKERKIIANLSNFHPSVVEGFKAAIKGVVVYKDISKAFPIKISLPHGHIACILELVKKLKFNQLFYRESNRMRNIALGAINMRILSPLSKLAAARLLSEPTATTSIGTLLNLGKVDVHEVSDSVIKKQKSRTTENGHPVHSFKTLMKDLQTFMLNEVNPPGNPDQVIHIMYQATEIQRRHQKLLVLIRKKCVH